MFINLDIKRKKNKPILHLAKPTMQVISVLSEAYDINYLTKMGDLNELSFSIPYKVDIKHKLVDNINTELLKERYLVRLKLGKQEEWFIVKNISDDASDLDKMTVNCLSLGYELTNEIITEYTAETNGIYDITSELLSDTLWTIGEVDDIFLTRYRSYDFSSVTVLEAIIQVAETLEAVLVWDTKNRKIHFKHLENYGVNRGFTVDYGRYLQSISRDRDSDEMVTRLRPYGSDDLTISEVNPSGVPYIEDFSYFMYPFYRDKNKKVIQSSHYMSDDLCHALLDFSEKAEQYDGRIKSLMDSVKSYQTKYIEEESKLTRFKSQLNITIDKLDVAKATEDKVLIGELVKEKESRELDVAKQSSETIKIGNELEKYKSDLTSLRQELSMERNFRPELIKEKKLYTITKEWRDDNYIDAQDLYDAALKTFKDMREPAVVMNIDIVNLLEIVEEAHNWDKLRLGDKMNVKYPQMRINSTATILQIDYNFEDGSVKLTISNITNVETDNDKVIKMIYDSSHTSATIESKKHKWNKIEDVEKNMNSIFEDEWDATKRQINAGVNNSVTINGRGIQVKNADNPNEMLIMQAGVLSLSMDGGETWKTAIKPDRIVAERVMGKLLAGEKLVIANDQGKFKFDKDGFQVDVNSFKVTSGNTEINMVEEWNTSSDFYEKLIDDGIITPPEKQQIKLNFNKIKQAVESLKAQVEQVWKDENKPVELTVLQKNYTELYDYLYVKQHEGGPILDDTTSKISTPIDRYELGNKFNNYYFAEEQLRKIVIGRLKENLTSVEFSLKEDQIISKVTNNSTFKGIINDLSQEIDKVQDQSKQDLEVINRRVTSAEEKITDTAIIETIKNSTEFINKADKDHVFTKDEINNLTSVNLLHNTEWLTNNDRWSLSTGWIRDDSKRLYGSKTLKVDLKGLGSFSYHAAFSEFIECSVREDFTLSVYVLSDAVETIDSDAYMEVEFFDKDDKRISSNGKSIKPSKNNEWQRFSYIDVAPTNAVKVRGRFHPRQNGRFWIGRPMLQRGRVLTSYLPHIDELAVDLSTEIKKEAGKISMVVSEDNKIKSEQIASSITMTPRALDIINQNITFKGKVNFEAFDINLQKTFNSDGTYNLTRAKGTLSKEFIKDAERWDRATDDAKKATEALTQINQDRNSWDTAYTRVDHWTSEGSAEIDGGKIKANSIIANQVAIGNWDNLFTNGTLEFGHKNFIGSSYEIINDPANAYQGNHYMKIYWNGQYNDVYDSTPLKVIEGEQYFLEGRARLLTGSDYTRTFIVQILDKNARVINHYIGNETLNTSWRQISWTVTIPKGGIAMRIGVSVGGEKNANNCTMFDSLFCKRMSEGKLIVDGSILANHIKAGELEVGKNIKMGENAIISWDKVSNKPDAEKLGALPINSPKLTQIDRNGIYTGTVYADQIVGDEIVGKTIKTKNSSEHLHLEDQVLRFVNQGADKIVIGFENEWKSRTSNPYIVLGQGNGNGRNFGSIYKDNDGVYYKYVDNSGYESDIRLTNQGNIGIKAQDGLWFTSKRNNFTAPIETPAIKFNSFGSTPGSQQGTIWVGNGYNGFGPYFYNNGWIPLKF